MYVRKIFVSAAFLVVSVVVAAAPVAADTELGHSGVLGAHSLSDTSSSPGATCRYKYKVEYTDGKLTEIVVRPPRMRAASGYSTQAVGWKFTVQRRVQGIGSASEWVARYTSAEMTANTTPDKNAGFNEASVPVITGGSSAGGVYQYRVLVTMIWHRSDGSVQGRARHRVDFYRAVLDTGQTEVRSKRCDGWWFLPD